MPTFAFRAFDSLGKRQRGTITASNGRHARQQLRSRGLKVESVVERAAEKGSRRQTSLSGRKTKYASQLTISVRELATLLRAGVPLLDALDSVVMQSRKGFREAMLAVRDRVASGHSLAESMEREPRVFDEMTVGMVRVGEHAGNLDEICEQVAEFRERSGELKDRVISALIYPLIILLVSVGVTLFLMTVVVPMLLQNLIEMGRPLPTPTVILKFLSDGLIDYGLWLLLAFIIGGVALVVYAQSPNGRYRLAKVSIATPVFGPLIQKQALSRMALVVSSLLRSGLELVDALEIAERTTTNVILRRALSSMRSDLKSGGELHEVVTKHSIFSHALAQVFALGQQTGQLDGMLERIGEDYNRQASLLANRLTSVIEPVLILVLSIVVGFVLFATVLPILEAGNVLSQ
ncbi:MAG: type II secretion system F family protein [Planctomycetota bacterium]